MYVTIKCIKTPLQDSWIKLSFFKQPTNAKLAQDLLANVILAYFSLLNAYLKTPLEDSWIKMSRLETAFLFTAYDSN